jgi:hypothetical protein
VCLYRTRNKSYEGQFKVKKKKITFIHFIFLESELCALPIINFLIILCHIPPMKLSAIVCRRIDHCFITVNNSVSYSEVPKQNPNPDTCPLYLNLSWFFSIIPAIVKTVLESDRYHYFLMHLVHFIIMERCITYRNGRISLNRAENSLL